MTRAVSIIFRLLLSKIFLIADSCLVYIADSLDFLSLAVFFVLMKDFVKDALMIFMRS